MRACSLVGVLTTWCAVYGSPFIMVMAVPAVGPVVALSAAVLSRSQGSAKQLAALTHRPSKAVGCSAVPVLCVHSRQLLCCTVCEHADIKPKGWPMSTPVWCCTGCLAKLLHLVCWLGLAAQPSGALSAVVPRCSQGSEKQLAALQSLLCVYSQTKLCI